MRVKPENAPGAVATPAGRLVVSPNGKDHPAAGYDQDFLERAAWAYRCEPQDLIMRNPLDDDATWSITDSIRSATPEERATIANVIAALVRKAG